MDVTFAKPVRILVGLGFPASISSVEHAHKFLSDLKVSSDRQSHSMALEACEAAMNGEIDVEIARTAFEAFADRRAMLLPPLLPSRSAERRLARLSH